MFKRKRQVARVQDLMREDTTPQAAQRAAARPPAPQPDLEHLEAEVRYHRDRLRLYRQRVVSAKPTSPTRLRELERVAAAAVERLQNARRGLTETARCACRPGRLQREPSHVGLPASLPCARLDLIQGSE